MSFSSLLLLSLTAGMQSGATTATIRWQGYEWHVRTAHAEGPGPNEWDRANVRVDDKGFLHLKITYTGGKWSCAEIWTTAPLGFGTYQCQVDGRIDHLDPNIVFSMFSYAGPDGTKEIDIEYAKWGNAKEKNSWWTVYPNDMQGKKESHGFNLSLDGSFTTQRYTWSAEGVHYWVFGGHQPMDSVTNRIEEWNHRPSDANHSITQNPIPLHFNLWLFEGKPPTDGKEVEIVVRSFKFAADGKKLTCRR